MGSEEINEELARRAARYWASQRRRVKGTCVVCGKPFEGTAKRRYCSHRCVEKAYRQRHHEEVLQRKREAYRRKREGQGGPGRDQPGEPRTT